MMNKRYILNQNGTVRDALVSLDGNTHDWQTLFIVDDAERMVGTLTDGDIRRGLIGGASLSTPVSEIMHTSFKFVRDGQYDAKLLKEFREKQIFFIPVLDNDGHVVKVCNLIKYRNFLPVDAVLMAGGKGERLRPLTEKTPKPLLPVGDKAIIDHNVDRLVSYGIKHISVTVNYLGEQLEEHFREPRNDVQIQTVREPKFFGTIGSIKFVPEFFNDAVLVMNSDLFTNINYEDFYLHFKEHDADMSVAAIPYDVDIPFGILNLDGRNITGLAEKPHYGYYANAGIYLIKKSAFDLIPEDTMFHSTDLLEALVTAGRKVIRFPLGGTWIDIGTPQEYRRAIDLVKYMQ
jgi:dTDP-glucose pyrophosphorylase